MKAEFQDRVGNIVVAAVDSEDGYVPCHTERGGVVYEHVYTQINDETGKALDAPVARYREVDA